MKYLCEYSGTKIQVPSDDLGGRLVLMQLVTSRMALRTRRAAPYNYRFSGNGRCFDCAVLLWPHFLLSKHAAVGKKINGKGKYGRKIHHYKEAQ